MDLSSFFILPRTTRSIFQGFGHLLCQLLLKDYQDQRLLKEIRDLGGILQRFSKNLSHLNRQWGLMLAENPDGIWLPSVNAFTDPEFYVGTDAASLKCLSCPEDTEPVLVTSQPSMDGKDVGIVKAWHSKYVIRCLQKIQSNPRYLGL